MARTQPGTVVLQGPDGVEERIRLDQDVTTLGRSDTCAVKVPLPIVSRLHARIELEHERYVLFDAGSANGTFLNGQRIDHGYELHTGDQIWLGSPEAALSFSDPDETALVRLTMAPMLVLDEQLFSALVYGAPAPLSPLEFRLLVYLASNRGTVCTREACFLAAWGQPYDHATCEDALNNCVSKLRRNLRATAEQAGKEPPAIVTIPRIGFRLDADSVFVARDEAASPPRARSLGE
jgi:DNA-binding winged helix-turn-helix (wHTH) protein